MPSEAKPPKRLPILWRRRRPRSDASDLGLRLLQRIGSLFGGFASLGIGVVGVHTRRHFFGPGPLVGPVGRLGFGAASVLLVRAHRWKSTITMRTWRAIFMWERAIE